MSAIVHHFEDLGRARIAVLNGVDARENCAPHTFGRRCVRSSKTPRVVSNGNSCRHLRFRKGRPARLTWKIMIIGVHLDDVRACRNLVAGGSGHFLGAADLLSALRNLHSGFETLGTISTARDIRLSRNQKARSWNNPLVDRLLETDVGIAGALGSKVALGCESRFECLSRVNDCARSSKGEGLVKDLIVPFRFVVGMKEQMRMTLDQSRE